MKSQHRCKPSKIKVVSKEEQHTDLCCNNVGLCCSSLEVINEGKEKNKQQLLEELADIFILSLRYELENEGAEIGSDLLPGINERAG